MASITGAQKPASWPIKSTARPPGPSMLYRGKIFAGKFQLAEQLAKGGMSEVWQAHDTNGRSGVLKMVYASQTKQRQTLLNEARIFNSLSGENVSIFPKFYGYFRSTQHHAIAMEKIKGMELTDLLKRPIPLPRIIDIMMSLCGLEALHNKGYVHRDLKPANIMVNGGKIKVIDLGLATETGITTGVNGRVFGTPDYMSPEQVQGLKLYPSSDIYQLGLIFFELITGYNPMGSANTLTIARNQLRKPLRDLTKIDVGRKCSLPIGTDLKDLEAIAAKLNKIIQKMTKKRATLRHQSLAEVNQELQRIKTMFDNM